jgi:hypothetical protein
MYKERKEGRKREGGREKGRKEGRERHFISQSFGCGEIQDQSTDRFSIW